MEYTAGMLEADRKAYAASKISSNMTSLQLESTMIKAGFKSYNKMSEDETKHLGEVLIEWSTR